MRPAQVVLRQHPDAGSLYAPEWKDRVSAVVETEPRRRQVEHRLKAHRERRRPQAGPAGRPGDTGKPARPARRPPCAFPLRRPSAARAPVSPAPPPSDPGLEPDPVLSRVVVRGLAAGCLDPERERLPMAGHEPPAETDVPILAEPETHVRQAGEPAREREPVPELRIEAGTPVLDRGTVTRQRARPRAAGGGRHRAEVFAGDRVMVVGIGQWAEGRTGILGAHRGGSARFRLTRGVCGRTRKFCRPCGGAPIAGAGHAGVDGRRLQCSVTWRNDAAWVGDRARIAAEGLPRHAPTRGGSP